MYEKSMEAAPSSWEVVRSPAYNPHNDPWVLDRVRLSIYNFMVDITFEGWDSLGPVPTEAWLEMARMERSLASLEEAKASLDKAEEALRMLQVQHANARAEATLAANLEIAQTPEALVCEQRVHHRRSTQWDEGFVEVYTYPLTPEAEEIQKSIRQRVDREFMDKLPPIAPLEYRFQVARKVYGAVDFSHFIASRWEAKARGEW